MTQLDKSIATVQNRDSADILRLNLTTEPRKTVINFKKFSDENW